MSKTTAVQILPTDEASMNLLKGKTAVIYGAAGGIGAAVSRVFAREGAIVFLAGRTLRPLETIAREISEAGGLAEAGQVDALDSAQVEQHLRGIVATKGKLDISFNLISTDVAMGSQLTQLSVEQFANAAFLRPKSNFITATAAARMMEKQGSGVILAITATNGRLPQGETGGFSIGNAAIETFCKQLAIETGPKGVRVVCIRTGATPDNPVLQEVYARLAEVRGITKEEVERSEADNTALKRSPRMLEVAKTAALLASHYASAITATPVNASCGQLVD
jgi:3-oxoacyl-[acyl-carrier protein] reductase